MGYCYRESKQANLTAIATSLNVYCAVQREPKWADSENLFSLVMDMPTWKAKEALCS